MLKTEDIHKPYAAEEAGAQAHLTAMNDDSAEHDKRFEQALRSYYGRSNIERMQCAHTFDLTFAHFWGRFGIPVYIPSGTGLFLSTTTCRRESSAKRRLFSRIPLRQRQ